MSEEAEPKKERIAPAITFKFEEFASRICDLSKVEPSERPLQIREWQVPLEERFRIIVADGRTSDEEAAKLALESFGDASGIAKTRRGGLKGFLHRVLYYESYRGTRLIFLATICLIHVEFRVSSSIKYTVVTGSVFNTSFLVPNMNYYLPILFMAVVAIPKWIRPRSAKLKRSVQMLATFAFCYFFFTVFKECLESVGRIYGDFTTGRWHRPDLEDMPIWKDALMGVIWFGSLLFEIVALVACAPLAASEIFEWPRRKRERLERRRREISVR